MKAYWKPDQKSRKHFQWNVKLPNAEKEKRSEKQINKRRPVHKRWCYWVKSVHADWFWNEKSEKRKMPEIAKRLRNWHQNHTERAKRTFQLLAWNHVLIRISLQINIYRLAVHQTNRFSWLERFHGKFLVDFNMARCGTQWKCKQ